MMQWHHMVYMQCLLVKLRQCVCVCLHMLKNLCVMHRCRLPKLTQHDTLLKQKKMNYMKMHLQGLQNLIGWHLTPLDKVIPIRWPF